MVSFTTIAALALIIGFLAFGGLSLSKKTLEDVKEKSEVLKSETQKRIEQIKMKVDK